MIVRTSRLAILTGANALALCLLFAAVLPAGELEDETKRLLAELPESSQEETEKILGRFAKIGPEACAARDTVYELFLTEKFRHDAGNTLAFMGTDAVPLIRKALHHEDPAVRSAMASAIDSMGPLADPLIPDLLRLIDDDAEYPVSMGEDVDPMMFKVSSSSARTLAALRLRPQDVVPSLVMRLKALSDGHEAAGVADTIWEMGIAARSAAPELAEIALTHPEPYARTRAFGALFAVDASGETALRTLSLAVQDREVYGMMWGSTVQRTVVEDLGLFGPRAAVAAPALLQVLQKNHKADDVDYADICMILADAGLREAIPVLRRDLDRKPVETDASRFIFFDEDQIPPLYEYTRDRAGGLAALARLEADNRVLIEELHRILQDDQWSVTEEVGAKGAKLRDPRAIAAKGLGRLGKDAQWTLPALRSAMKHDPEQVTELAFAAAWAVARLDPEDRECLSVLQHVVFHERFWDSPYYGESAESVLAVLGPRVDELLPHIVRSGVKDTRFFGDSHFLMDLLTGVGPKALRMYVEQKFQRLESKGYFGSLFPTLRELDDLGPRGAPVIDVLTEFMASKNHEIRAVATYHLGSIGPDAKTAVPQLKAALGDERVIVRACAAMALERIGPAAADALEELRRLSKEDAYQTVRDAAAKACVVIQQRK